LSWLKLPERRLAGGVIECFFFDAVIIRASLAAKPPNIVERLIAVPAGAFWLQVGEACRLHGLHVLDRLSTIVYLVCITHDSAAIKKYWSAPDIDQAPKDGPAKSACSIAPRGLQCEQYSPKPASDEKYGKKFVGMHRFMQEAEKSPPSLRRRANLSTLEGTPARTAFAPLVFDHPVLATSLRSDRCLTVSSTSRKKNDQAAGECLPSM
jgi:hypothetical protein